MKPISFLPFGCLASSARVACGPLTWILVAILLVPPLPAFQPNSIEECLEATVRITTTRHDDQQQWGTGFLLNEGGSTYIYTNAHVIERGKRFEIRDHEGNQITDIAWIEAFANPFGQAFDLPSSGDGVRLRLRNRREKALELAEDWNDAQAGKRIFVLGDNDGPLDGKHEVEILEGRITGAANGILQYDAKIRQGSSGGAVISSGSLRVLGLNTWAALLSEDAYKRLFGIAEERGVGWGVSLRNSRWKKFSIKDYLSQGEAIEKMRHNLEIMILLSYLTPTGHGIYVNFDAPFVAGMTMADAIEKHQDEKLLKSLFRLSAILGGKARSNVKTSNQDLYRLYIQTLDGILAEHRRVVPSLHPDRLSYYHSDYLKRRHLNLAGGDYFKSLSACREWFGDKVGVGGSITPGEWETLPPFGDRLAADFLRRVMNE